MFAAVERLQPEDRERHERMFDALLPRDECREQEPGGDEHADRPPGGPSPAVTLGDAEDEERQPGGDEHRARDVESLAVLVEALGEQERRQDQSRHAHGDVDEEDPLPRQVVRQDPAEQDAGCGAEATDGTPRAQGDVALAPLGEHCNEDGESSRRDESGAEALERTRGDQRALTPRQAAEERAEREDDRPEDEDASPAEQVRRAAAQQEEAAEHERVGADHPLEVLLREAKIQLDGRQARRSRSRRRG